MAQAFAVEIKKSHETVEKLIDKWKGKAMDMGLEQALSMKLKLLNVDWDVPTVEADSDILEEEFSPVYAKFLVGQPYRLADVQKCAELVFNENRTIPLKRLAVTISTAGLHKFLKNNKGLDSLFLIFEEEPKLWVTFAIIKAELPQTDPKKEKQQQWTVLYKQPNKDGMGQSLQDFFKKENANTTILCNDYLQFSGWIEEAYDYSGPLAVRNLGVIKSLVEKRTTSLEDLRTAPFTDVKTLKLLIKQKMKFNAQALYENVNFKAKFEKFKESLPRTFKANVKKFLVGLKQNRDYHALREKYFNDEVLKATDESMTDDFSQELQAFQTTAKILSCCKQEGQLFKACSEGVKVGFNKLLDLEVATMEKVFRNEYKVTSFEPHLLHPNECKPISASSGSKRSYDSIMENFRLKYAEDAVKRRLRKVNNFYQIHTEKDREFIRTWANNIRGIFKIDNNVNDGKNSYFRNLANIKRGFVLSTGNENCQELLVLYLLMILDEKKTKLVTLPDMRTRTYLIATIAVVKVLMGYKVDVITNSEAQSKEAISLTQKLYNIFGVSVAHNCSKEFVRHTRSCYLSDVVYGPMKNFQFDHLKEEVEGIPIRGNRPYKCLLIDEADNLGISESRNWAKLSSHFPGMEYHRYIYLRIWEELRQHEAKYAAEVNKDVVTKLKEITTSVKSRGFTDAGAQVEYEKFLEASLAGQVKSFESKILMSDAQNIEILPRHLKTLVEAKFGKWVKSAIYARFNCVENRDYRIIADKIVPIDAKTGIPSVEGVWTDGLHQFLQLKHGLRLSCEKLKSVFISNVGYINKYIKDEVFCLASTFGNPQEQNLLSKVHDNHVTFVDLPDAQGRTLEQQLFVPGVICEDSAWHAKVVEESVRSLLENRAVVVVCRNFEDAECLTESFQFLKSMDIRCNVRKYFEEAHIVGFQDVDVYDVIITTSLAAVSVGFQLTNNWLSRNGIRLILGFMPHSQREEERILAIARELGDAKKIIRMREITRFALKTPREGNARAQRDEEDNGRLNFLETKILKEIKFKDEIFERFKKFYTGYRLMAGSDAGKFLVLRDLKESWGLWLERQEFTSSSKDFGGLRPEEEFSKFLKEMGLFQVLNMDGTTFKNPYYVILRADQEINERCFDEAEVRFGPLLKDFENIRFLASANLKLFQFLLESRHYIYNRLINLDKKFAILKKTADIDTSLTGPLIDLMQSMKSILGSVKRALKEEIDFLKENVISDYAINRGVENVVVARGNRNCPFLEQMISRLAGLKAFTTMVERLEKDYETSHKLIPRFKVPRYFQEDPELKRIVLAEEIDELEDEGLNSIYSLDIVREEFSIGVVKSTKRLISIGRKLSNIAIFFPEYALVGVVAAVDGICASVISVFTDFENYAEASRICLKVLSPIPTHRLYSDEFLSTDLVVRAVEACQQMFSSLAETPLIADIRSSLLKFSQDMVTAKNTTLKENRILFNPVLEQIGFEIVTNSRTVLSQPAMKIFLDSFTPWLGEHLGKHLRAKIYNEKSIKMILKYNHDSEETIVNKIINHVLSSYSLVDVSVAMAKRFRDFFTNWLFFAGVADIYNRDPNFTEKELIDFSADLNKFITDGNVPIRGLKAKNWDDLFGKINGGITSAITEMTFKVVFSSVFFSEGPQALYGFEEQLKREGPPAKKLADFQIDYALAALNLYFIGKIGKDGVGPDRLHLLRRFQEFMKKY